MCVDSLLLNFKSVEKQFPHYEHLTASLSPVVLVLPGTLREKGKTTKEGCDRGSEIGTVHSW